MLRVDFDSQFAFTDYASPFARLAAPGDLGKVVLTPEDDLTASPPGSLVADDLTTRNLETLRWREHS